MWVADRVDDSLVEYRERHGITAPWETRERVVVALTGAPGAERLIRRGARMASRSRAELVGVHVRSADGRRPSRRTTSISSNGTASLLDELEGRYVEVSAPTRRTCSCAPRSAENATQIVMGSSHRSRWAS